MDYSHRKMYIEYHIPYVVFVPSSEMGPPAPPPPASECVPSLDPKVGKATIPGVRPWGVGGAQFGRLERKPGTLYTLCGTWCVCSSFCEGGCYSNWRAHCHTCTVAIPPLLSSPLPSIFYRPTHTQSYKLIIWEYLRASLCFLLYVLTTRKFILFD